jgi:ferredoxin
MSLVVQHISCDVSDDSSEEENCFPGQAPVAYAPYWSTIPVEVRRNRDFADLQWSLICRNCSYAIDACGFCICTHTASDNYDEENEVPEKPAPLKRTLTDVIDLTGDVPNIISFKKSKK